MIISIVLQSPARSQSLEVVSPGLARDLDNPQFLQQESGFFFFAAGRDAADKQAQVAQFETIAQCILWHKSFELLYQMGDRREPHLIYTNGHQHSTIHDGENDFPISIQFVLDEGIFKSKVRRPDAQGELVKSDFSIRLDDFLQRCEGAPGFEQRVRSSVSMRCGHRVLYGVARSAVAHEFFGHPLMHLVLRGDNDLIQLMGGFCTTLDSPKPAGFVGLAFQIPDDFLSQVSQGGLATAGDWGVSLAQIRSKGQVDVNSSASLAFEADEVIRLTNGDFESQADGFRRCVALTQKSNDLVDRYFCQGDAIVLDPVARGFFLEQLTWDDQSRASLLMKFSVMLRAFQEREMLFSVTANAASIGLGVNPLSLGSLELFWEGNGRPENRAAIAAHWDLPVSPTEIASVAELLSSAKLRQTRIDAMDVLILLGALDRIPAEPMAMWSQMNLVDASVTLRRRKLAYLMKTAKGRQFLLSKLADGSLPEEVQVLVKSIIRTHVEATQQLKRFDMISEAELQDLQAAL